MIKSAEATIPRAKRAADLAAIFVLVPVVIPVSLLIALAVFLDSPGPVIYRAKRLGTRGHKFEMIKFRTMGVGLTGTAIAASGDHRITPVGSFLRATRLDELPQLWNVLRGQMSFVGPRPELEEFVDLHAVEYREILAVAPGITGPTQLRFAGVEANLLSLQDDPEAFYRAELLPDKVEMDLQYARTRSFLRDLKYLGETLGLPLILAFQRKQGNDRMATGRGLVYVGTAAVVAIAIPVIFAVGLGSPR